MLGETKTTGRAARRSYLSAGGRRLGTVFLLVLVVVGSACRTAPITGRRTVNLFSVGQELEMGRTAFAEVRNESKLVTRGRDHDMVQRVMDRIVAVSDNREDYEWEVELIDADDTVNAFALPGGKMAVYTGILPVCRDDTGLAVVIGHEIGHVVASHGTERVTQNLGAEVLLQLLNLGDYQALGQAALQYGALLPFGRTQESEADEIGLIYMARAGYDPREAVAFWSRMNELTQGGGGPEFLSTHPSHETRVQRLQAKMPAALEVWRAAGGR